MDRAPEPAARTLLRSGDDALYGVREFREGDDPRRIHWRTSARRGTVVVRQFEQHRSDDIHILVDLWQATNPTDSQRQAVEVAVSLAATLVTDVCRRRGKRLRVSIAGLEYWHRGGQPTLTLLNDISDALAVAAPHSNPRLPDALARAMRRGSAAQTVMISTRSATTALNAHGAARNGPESAIGHVKWIDVTAPELIDYFEIPSSAEATPSPVTA